MKLIKIRQIQDIFSPKKKRNKDNQTKKIFKVIADYREKNSLVPSELSNLGIEVEFKELKVGDFIANSVVIERKTVSDFINSMLSKRLISQLENMQQFQNKLLIIEGIDEQELYSDKNFSENETGIHPNAIRGFLLSIVLKYNVPIIFSKDAEDTAKFIYLIAKKQEREISLNSTKKARNKKEQMQFILEGFPGIGPKTSRKILEKFGSIKNFVNASEEELKKVLGKKAESIKEILN